MITEAILHAIAPKGHMDIMAAIAPALENHLPLIGVNTPRLQAHFLAQAAEESDGFKTLHEYWGPTKAQKGYEGRKDLGNIYPGDGYRYRGRGIFQLTGRGNYWMIGAALGLDLEGNPDLAALPENAVRIACEFWRSRNINPLAAADNLEAVTRKINGGLNGIEDRCVYLIRAKKVLGA